MIFSRTNKFVFIKTRKTASTSLEIFFSRFCDNDDIITPVLAEDEVLRLDQGGPLPQNYSISREREEKYRSAIKSRDLELIRKSVRAKELIFRNHMHLSEVREKISIPNDYLVISSERHPFEKVVSMTYFYLRNKDSEHSDFSTVIDEIIATEKYRNIDAYRDKSGELATRIIRYEHLQADLRAVCEELGLEYCENNLPMAKSSFRKSRINGEALLSERQKQRIVAVCKDEFEQYGYHY